MKNIDIIATCAKPQLEPAFSGGGGGLKALSKPAFTLAEVMITLAIIGILASITIPPLISKYENMMNVVKLKKVYALLSQVGPKMMADTGCGDLECTGFWTTDGMSDPRYVQTMATFKQYIDPAYDCYKGVPFGSSSYGRQCEQYPSLPVFQNYDRTSPNDAMDYSGIGIVYGFKLPYDSIIYVALDPWPDGKTRCTGRYGCTLFYIVTDGKKRTHTWGRDIFLMNLANNGKIDMMNVPFYGACTDEDKRGKSCGWRIQSNGWVMDY